MNLPIRISVFAVLLIFPMTGCQGKKDVIPAKCRTKIDWFEGSVREGKLKAKDFDEMIGLFNAIPDLVVRERCFMECVRRMTNRDISSYDYYRQSWSLRWTYDVARRICLGMRRPDFTAKNWFLVHLEMLKWYRAQIVRLEKERNCKRTFEEDSQYRSCRHGWEVGYQVEINGLEEMLDTSVRKVASAEEFAQLSAAFEKFLGRKLLSAAEAWKAQGNAVKFHGKLPDTWFALYGTTNAPAAKKGDPK